METEDFWRLVEDSRDQAGGDPARQAEVLVDLLASRPPADIVSFDATFRRLVAGAYDWDLWGVGYLAAGGMSDDGFIDFRSWLVAQGRSTYEQVTRDPDALADIEGVGDDLDVQVGEAEEVAYAAAKAHERATGHEIPEPDGTDPLEASQVDDDDSGPGVEAEPRGEAWDEDDADRLAERFPRSWARWGWGEESEEDGDDDGASGDVAVADSADDTDADDTDDAEAGADDENDDDARPTGPA